MLGWKCKTLTQLVLLGFCVYLVVVCLLFYTVTKQLQRPLHRDLLLVRSVSPQIPGRGNVFDSFMAFDVIVLL